MRDDVAKPVSNFELTPPPAGAVPTLYDWMGGAPALTRLMTRFYAAVPADPVLAPVFAHMAPSHAEHVSQFVGEVFGGPASYTANHGGAEGGHLRMVAQHLGRALSEGQRARWVGLLLQCADEVGLPADPEFRSAFVAYLEWGSRLAVLNSQPGIPAPAPAPMPIWGWGVPGGPYRPDGVG